MRKKSRSEPMTCRHGFIVAGLVILGSQLLSHDAAAIVIRHDVEDSAYVVDDADYAALVDLFDPGDCIGTLITADTLITVAHCAEELAVSELLTLQDTSYAVAAVTLHPDYDGENNDIALIRLEEKVIGVAPHSLYRESDEEGQTVAIVGRGTTATGLVGEPGGAPDGKLRRASNIVSSAEGQWLKVYFEAPGESGVTPLEGVGAAGDSGCPVFIETENGPVIAGLNSWGEGEGSIEVGQYGAWDHQTRISYYLPWIETEISNASDDSNGDQAEGEDSKTSCATLNPSTMVGWMSILLVAGCIHRFVLPRS